MVVVVLAHVHVARARDVLLQDVQQAHQGARRHGAHQTGVHENLRLRRQISHLFGAARHSVFGVRGESPALSPPFVLVHLLEDVLQGLRERLQQLRGGRPARDLHRARHAGFDLGRKRPSDVSRGFAPPSPRGRVGDQSVSVGDERRRAANRRRGPTTDATPWLYARSFGERVCLPRRLGRTFNALARMEAGDDSRGSGGGGYATQRFSMLAQLARRRSPCGTGGRLRGGAGRRASTGSERVRVSTSRYASPTMSRRFVRACVSKTATRRTRDVEQFENAFRDGNADIVLTAEHARASRSVLDLRGAANARQRPRDLASGARSRRGGERGTHKYATLVF